VETRLAATRPWATAIGAVLTAGAAAAQEPTCAFGSLQVLFQEGFEDDDDLNLADFAPGDLDPDSASDPARPLVFYEVTLDTATLRLRRDATGRIVLTY
jgi:hypothetical protein